MAEPRPANDSAPIRPSLFDRTVEAARAVPRPSAAPEPTKRIDRRGMALATAIVATPLLTWIGATLLTAQVREEARRLSAQAATTNAVRSDRDRARMLLQRAWNAPTLGTTIEAIARALPEDAALLRVERGTMPLTIEVAAPDPDRVLAALRRDPALGGMRAVAQSRSDSDGRMRITMEQAR